ncbi:MAG: P-loop NTPase fold protein [bacterium]|nr:P-loop NTPase fold protein [bacterium]
MKNFRELSKDLKARLKVVIKLSIMYSMLCVILYVVFTWLVKLFPDDIMKQKTLSCGWYITIFLVECILGALSLYIVLKCKNIRFVVRDLQTYINFIVVLQFGYFIIQEKELLYFVFSAGCVVFVLIAGRMLKTMDVISKPIDEKTEFTEYDLYSDEPVSSKVLLSKHLQQELDKVQRVIDNQNTNAPFTMSFEGEWGKGKTSVMVSLEQELLKRKEGSKRYFVLKIDTLLFKTTEDIILYIKKYLQSLFFIYNVDVFRVNRLDDYLSVILGTLGEESKIVAHIISLRIQPENWFRNVYESRKEFQNKIEKLLENSGRQKIILLIDDTDRDKDKEKAILETLKEVFTINGFLSIVLRKQDCNNDNELDKFIQMRIKINDDKKIEYDGQINELIRVGGNRYLESIATKDLMTIQCYTKSLTEYYSNLQIITKLLGKKEKVDDETNLLFDVFIIDIVYNSRNIGEHISKIIMQYVSQQHEIGRLKKEIETIKREHPSEEQNFLIIYIESQLSIYFDITDSDMKSEYDWMARLNQFTSDAPMLLRKLINIFNRGTYDDCECFEDILNKYLINKTLLKGTHQFIRNAQYQLAWHLLFDKDKRGYLDECISQHKINELIEILKSKLEIANQRRIEVILLEAFLVNIRNIANSPRTLKFFIRESILYGRNLLEYILEKIEIDAEMEKKLYRFSSSKNKIGMKELENFLNKAFYYYYIYQQLDEANKMTTDSFVTLYSIDDKFYLVYYSVEEIKDKKEIKLNYKVIPIASSDCDLDETVLCEKILGVIKEDKSIKDANKILFFNLKSNEVEYIKNMY